jgi:hypothetical protein
MSRWQVQIKGAAAMAGTAEYVEEDSDYSICSRAMGETLL